MSYLPEIHEEFCIDESTELTVDEFLKKANLKEFNFYKIANSGVKPMKSFEKNPDVNPILYTPVDNHTDSYKQYKECIYLLTINSRVVKIGGTYTGMKKRHASYNCGTRKARGKGTCSVTNFNITEAQYAAISNGKSVEWYVYDVPPEPVERKIWNTVKTVFPKFYTFFEADLCEMYVKLTGHRPLLSKNAGVE